jgi:SagB-type dehydrogenase family enzyme
MIRTATEYHDATSYDRDRMAGHYMDWANQPDVYKHYQGLEPVLLPKEVRPPDMKLSSVLKQKEMKGLTVNPDAEQLSLILLLAYGFTDRARHPDGDFYYRSAASAGALYPTEIYVAAQDVRGLSDGIYHFALHLHGLVPLRKQRLSSHVLAITRTQGIESPMLTFFLTAIFFRSSWKYRDRSYRYHLLDTGHVAENLILALKGQGLPFSLTYDFEDDRVNHLLGLDEAREVALAVVHVFGKASTPESREQKVPPLPQEIRAASRVSRKEVDYPAIRDIHVAGTPPLRRGPIGHDPVPDLGLAPETWESLVFPSPWPEAMTHPQAVFRRRSGRNFVKRALEKEAAMALLDSLCTPGDTEPIYERSVSTGFLIGNVDGMDPGFYLLDRKEASTGMTAPGLFMQQMAHICLDQLWLAHGAIHFLFLANLDTIEKAWGARAYRYAMMSAGRMGERLYLAATAMGLGCCGIGALYDREAAELLRLNKSSRLLYLVAVGKVKRA